MNSALRAARIALLLCGAGVCVCVSLLTLHLDRLLGSVNLTHTQQLLDKDLVKFGDTMVLIDATANTVRLQSASEATALNQWNRQVSAALAQANATLSALQGSANGLTAAERQVASSAQQSISGLQPLESGAAEEMNALHASTDSLNRLLADTDIADTLKSAQAITADAARITADAAYEADKYTHPPKKKLTFWAALWAGIEFVHKLEPPLF